jgi:hypothetical protein
MLSIAHQFYMNRTDPAATPAPTPTPASSGGGKGARKKMAKA